MIETSQKCLFDLVMLYAKVHDNKMCNAQIGEGWWLKTRDIGNRILCHCLKAFTVLYY